MFKNQIKQKMPVEVMQQQTTHCSLCFIYYEYWDLLKVKVELHLLIFLYFYFFFSSHIVCSECALVGHH